MTLDACYDALGLAGPSSRQDVQRAYKRLVLKYHPDRCGDDAAAAARFRLATEAYAILRTLHAHRATGATIGLCSRCDKVDRLLRGLHDRLCCPACLLGERRRQLPLPVYRTVRCLLVIGLQAGATYFLWRAVFEPEGGMNALRGVACALISLLALAAALAGADRIQS